MLVLVVLIAVVAVELMDLGGKLKSGRKQVEDLQTQKQQMAWDNESLKSALDKADDVDFILGLAQDEFNYLPPNARQFVDVSSLGG